MSTWDKHGNITSWGGRGGNYIPPKLVPGDKVVKINNDRAGDFGDCSKIKVGDVCVVEDIPFGTGYSLKLKNYEGIHPTHNFEKLTEE